MLETEVFLYGVMLLGVVGVALATRQYRSAATHLRPDHARALGLSQSLGADGPILRGTRDGVKVRVEHVQLGYGEHQRHGTRVVAVGVAAGLGFSAETARSGLLSAVGLGDVRVGDAAFDAHVRVAATTAQLARSARRDPDPTLRLRSLLALADTRSGPETVAVANEALTDVDTRIQLLAAMILGDAERLRLAPAVALHGLAPHAPERLARGRADRAPADRDCRGS